MKKNIIKFFASTIFLTSFLVPNYALAAHCDGIDPQDCVHAAPYTGATLTNPLAGGGINDIPTLVARLLTIIVTIGVPLIALAIIYAGFKFVTAQGNPEKLEEAKKNLLWIIVGAAILLSAYAIAQGIEATISDIRGN